MSETVCARGSGPAGRHSSLCVFVYVWTVGRISGRGGDIRAEL